MPSFIQSTVLALLPAMAAAISPGCNTAGYFYPLALDMGNSSSALAYCSSNYPVQATTIGLAGPFFTANQTVAFTTVTSTTGTASTVVTAPAVTNTQTVTVGATVTVTGSAVLAKRWLDERAVVYNINGTNFTRAIIASRTTTLSPQQSMMSQLTAQAASIISQICLCIETPQTVTNQLNASTTTQPVTGTVFSFVAGSVTVTSTPIVSAFVTVTATQTVTVQPTGSSTSVAQNTVNTSVPPTTSSTTVPVTTSSTTSVAPGATAGVRAGVPSCNAPESADPGTGGCSADCYCAARINQLNGASAGGYCSQAVDCSVLNIGGGQFCGQDSDCPANTICDASGFLQSMCGGPVCTGAYTACTTTFLGKRDTSGLGASWASGPWSGRMQKREEPKIVKRLHL